MKRSFVLAAMTALIGVAAGSMAGAAGNDFDYCLVCHGANANGNAAIHAPKVSGLEPWYVARQLEAFAAGTRGVNADDAAGHEMGPIGLRLKQAGQIDAAVQFVGSLNSAKPSTTVAGDVANGARLYGACAGCHGTQGEGNDALKAPALAARTDWYLVTQLRNFRQGVRGSDPADIYGAQMRAVASTLADDKAIDDVVAYIDTLK